MRWQCQFCQNKRAFWIFYLKNVFSGSMNEDFSINTSFSMHFRTRWSWTSNPYSDCTLSWHCYLVTAVMQGDPLCLNLQSGPRLLTFVWGCFGSVGELRDSWGEMGNNFPRCGTKASCWQAVCRVGQGWQKGCGLPVLEEQTRLLLSQSVVLTACWAKTSCGIPINLGSEALRAICRYTYLLKVVHNVG